MGNLLWSNDRPEFVERVASLAGGTTYREPVGGHSTSADHLPDAHAIASALAFARRGPQDIGPDVAYCWVLRSDAYRNRVVSVVAGALVGHALRGVRGYLTLGANAAWEELIWDRTYPRPAGIPEAKWELVTKVAQGVMVAEAMEALTRAERAYTRRVA